MTVRMNGQRVGIRQVVSPAPRGIWAELLHSDPLALETQSPDWADAMCAAGSFTNVSRLYETDAGRYLVVPMLRRSYAGGAATFDGSNPKFCGVGGVLAAGGPTVSEIAAVLADLELRRSLSQSILPHPLLAAEWAAAVPPGASVLPRRAHLIDLRCGWESLWTKGFTKSTRSGVRRAERRGVTVACGTAGDLVPEFYHLLEQAATRWARLQHEPHWLALRRLRHRDPRAKFEALGRFLGDRCRVWVASVNGRPAAASVVLQGTNAYDSRAAMDEDLTSYRANDLLLRHTIKDACDAGCSYYYMGESGESASLAQFKERFGATGYPYAEYRMERLPISGTERQVKRVVKRAIGFKD